jgi:hypothetical protein
VGASRRWELWRGEGGHSFFPGDHEAAKADASQDGLSLEWECEAAGYNDAMRQLYAHLGWGSYAPMTRKDGRPYPEDEGGAPK